MVTGYWLLVTTADTPTSYQQPATSYHTKKGPPSRTVLGIV